MPPGNEVEFAQTLVSMILMWRQRHGAWVDRVDSYATAPLAHNEILVNGRFRIIVETVMDPPEGQQPSAPETGINPVTFTPRDDSQPVLVISRMHLTTWAKKASRQPAPRKTVTVMMHHGTTQDEDLVGLSMFDEDHIIDGLLALFPHGELADGGNIAPGTVWPVRRLKWETSDLKEWSHPDLASEHQRELDREVTRGDEGRLKLWYLIANPGMWATYGQARTLEDLKDIQSGIAKVPGYSFYSGFADEESARAFGRENQLEAAGGD